MAKRSNSRRFREQRIMEEDEIFDIENTGESPPMTVRLVCVLGTGKYIFPSPSGKIYEFIGNQALDVDMEDAKILLAKRKGCCGSEPRPIFVTV